MQLNGRDSSILNLPTTKLKPSNSLILSVSTENMICLHGLANLAHFRKLSPPY